MDEDKKIKGRKCHVMVDALGLSMVVPGHETNIHDSKGTESALVRLAHKFPKLRKIFADGVYRAGLTYQNSEELMGYEHFLESYQYNFLVCWTFVRLEVFS